MGDVEALPPASRPRRCEPQVLICVDALSLGFLRSHPTLPSHISTCTLKTSEDVLDKLWHDPDRVATVVLDLCRFDFEELFYASLNHRHVSFVVRSHDIADGIWRRRYARQPNIKLPCTDYMVWTYAFSSPSSPLIRLRSDPI